MKKVILLFGLSILIVITTVAPITLADDDDEREYIGHGRHDEEESPYEELGEVLGWGSVFLALGAGLPYPFRRFLPKLTEKLPIFKSRIISLIRLLTKKHVLLGLLAIALMVIHGWIMYLAEGELDGEGWLGIIAGSLFVIAIIPGSILIKNKRVKFARKFHTTTLIIAGLTVLIHVVV